MQDASVMICSFSSPELFKRFVSPSCPNLIFIASPKKIEMMISVKSGCEIDINRGCFPTSYWSSTFWSFVEVAIAWNPTNYIKLPHLEDISQGESPAIHTHSWMVYHWKHHVRKSLSDSQFLGPWCFDLDVGQTGPEWKNTASPRLWSISLLPSSVANTLP